MYHSAAVPQVHLIIYVPYCSLHTGTFLYLHTKLQLYYGYNELTIYFNAVLLCVHLLTMNLHIAAIL